MRKNKRRGQKSMETNTKKEKKFPNFTDCIMGINYIGDITKYCRMIHLNK